MNSRRHMLKNIFKTSLCTNLFTSTCVKANSGFHISASWFSSRLPCHWFSMWSCSYSCVSVQFTESFFFFQFTSKSGGTYSRRNINESFKGLHMQPDESDQHIKVWRIDTRYRSADYNTDRRTNRQQRISKKTLWR